MKITNLKWMLMLSAVMVALSACSSNAPSTAAAATRVATQTPWIIYVPVTTTPEPATVTPLPTVAVQAATSPTRTPTRAVTAAARPSSTPTKAGPAPTAVAVATKAPECSLGTVSLREPNDGALRQTKTKSIGGDTFRFIWDPPPSLAGPSDANVGYQLTMNAKRGNFANGATIFISHNKFLNDGKLYIFDKPNVASLTGGEDVIVTWNVVIIRTSNGFNDNDLSARPAGIITCGPASPTWKIDLKVVD